MTTLDKNVSRVTREAFFNYGPHAHKRFVATLGPVDLLVLRPLRSRREEAAVSFRLCDLYRYGLLCRARNTVLEKARAKKAKQDEARKRRALDREIRKNSS